MQQLASQSSQPVEKRLPRLPGKEPNQTQMNKQHVIGVGHARAPDGRDLLRLSPAVEVKDLGKVTLDEELARTAQLFVDRFILERFTFIVQDAVGDPFGNIPFFTQAANQAALNYCHLNTSWPLLTIN